MRTAPLVWGTWNTHISKGLHAGGLGWLLREAPGVVGWSLQEVTEVEHLRSALQRAEALDDWIILPGQGYVRRGALPYLLVRKGLRFEVVSCSSRPIVPAAHPRALAQVVLWDHWTEREVYASSVHVDPLGRGFAHAQPKARRRHEEQVQQYADEMDSCSESRVAIAAGDWNEQLGHKVPPRLAARSARGRMAKAGAAPGFRLADRGDLHVHMDDVFVRTAPHTDVIRRRVLSPPLGFKGHNHSAIILRLRVRVRT